MLQILRCTQDGKTQNVCHPLTNYLLATNFIEMTAKIYN